VPLRGFVPLELLMELCLSACDWFAADAGNVLVVHCSPGYARSASFLSCLMAFRGFCSQPKEALKEICDQLPVDGVSAILPSQQRYLAYYLQCQQGFTPRIRPLQLCKAMLNGVPVFESEGSVAFRPFLEVRNKGELVFSSFKGDKGDVWPSSYSRNDAYVSFQLPGDLVVDGDVILEVRHVYLNGKQEAALQMAFHTAFLPGGLQLGKSELDGASSDQRFSDEFFVDLLFQEISTSQEDAEAEAGTAVEVSPVFEKARSVSRRLCEEEEQRRQQEAAATPSPAGGSNDEDDVEALEATLMRGSAASTSASSTAVATTADPVAKTSAATVSAGAEELKKALAAAAADEASVAAAASPSETAAAPAPTPAAQAAPAPVATASSSQAKPGSDIDNLFSEFDAALSTTATPKSAAGGYSAATTPAPAAKESTEKEKKDVLADVDDFLAELDSGLGK